MNNVAVLKAYLELERHIGRLEGALSGLLGQQREFLEKLKVMDQLVIENRQWRRHVERLMRQKEALLEAHGVRSLERQGPYGPFAQTMPESKLTVSGDVLPLYCNLPNQA